MDQVELALTTFRQIARALSQAVTEQASDDVEVWLAQFVCGAVNQLVGNRVFQGHCRWSVETLSSTSSPQRKALDEVDSALVEGAQTLLEVVAQSSLANSAGASIRFRPSGVAPARSIPVEELISVIRWISDRPWFGLASPEDFFAAVAGLQATRTPEVCRRAFWDHHDPRIPMGDSVARGMFARVACYASFVDCFWQPCSETVMEDGRERPEWRNEMASRLIGSQGRLKTARAGLQRVFGTDSEMRMRDACCTLIQIYAAYSDAPDLRFLDLSVDDCRVSASQVRLTVRPPGRIVTQHTDASGVVVQETQVKARLCRPDIITGIAQSLSHVAPLLRRSEDPDQLVEWASQSRRLVLVDRRPRTVFWEGEPIDCDWDRNAALWDLLWSLADQACAGRPVNAEDLTAPEDKSNKVKHRRSRLSKNIPPALDALIEDARPRGYWLNLEASAIRLLELDGDGVLNEVR